MTPDPALPIDLNVAKPASALVVVCLGGFLGSLVFTSRAGSYIMSLFDEALVPLTLFIIVVFQNGTLAWVYGANRSCPNPRVFPARGPLPGLRAELGHNPRAGDCRRR